MCEVYEDEDEVYYESYLKGMVKLKEERDELLGLLREMVLNFEDTAGHHCDDCEELIEKAKQAIAKARGEKHE